jgi:hypothetical protein
LSRWQATAPIFFLMKKKYLINLCSEILKNKKSLLQSFASLMASLLLFLSTPLVDLSICHLSIHWNCLTLLLFSCWLIKEVCLYSVDKNLLGQCNSLWSKTVLKILSSAITAIINLLFICAKVKAWNNASYYVS